MNERKRGVLITIFLALQAVGAFYGMFVYYTNQWAINMAKANPQLADGYTILNSTQVILNTLVSFITLIAIVGVFKWYRGSIYLYVIINAISSLMGILFQPHIQGIISYIVKMFVVVIVAKTLLKRIDK